MCHSTHVIPFRVQFAPGLSIFEQVVYAAKKAMIAGQLRPGDAFPSVRALSRELKINPNTAHKIVAQLVADELLETRPGIGTVVATLPRSTSTERARLLDREVEGLVLGAKRLGIVEPDLVQAVHAQWGKLSRGEKARPDHSLDALEDDFADGGSKPQ